MGVAIFFALAGFLLFRPYVAEHLDHVRAPAFRRYWFRRGLRIVPAYWLALTLLLILGLITLDSRWWEHYGLVQIYDRYEVLGGNVGAWSLAVELSFYLALPLAVLAMRSPRFGADRRSRVRGAALLVAAIWFAGVAFRLIAHGYTGSRASIAYDTLFAHLDWFAIGMGLAVLSAAMAGGSARPASVAWIEEHAGLTWLAALAVFVYVSVGLGESGNWSEPHGTFGWLMMHVLYGVIAGLLLAPAIFPGARRSLVHDFLGHPVVGGLGVISYGVFLYNGPIAAWLGRSKLSGLWAGRPFYGIVLATLVLSITAAVFSYRLVERPLLRFKDWRPEPATARSPEPAPPAG